MSGHNKWSTIKHRKGAQDAKRSKIFSRLAKAIIISVQVGGDDIEKNSSLKIAIEQARKANMPKDNIKRAIQRGNGQGGEGLMEEIIYEAYFPTNTDEMIAMMILCATDNKNRTVSELKSTLKKNGGKMVPNGSVSFQFEQVGQFELTTDNLEEAELIAIEAGAQDIQELEGDKLVIITKREDVQKIYKTLERQNLQVDNLKISHITNQLITIDKITKKGYDNLLVALDELDDIQEIFDNVK